jgi:hypothetical protein
VYATECCSYGGHGRWGKRADRRAWTGPGKRVFQSGARPLFIHASPLSIRRRAGAAAGAGPGARGWGVPGERGLRECAAQGRALLQVEDAARACIIRVLWGRVGGW